VPSFPVGDEVGIKITSAKASSRSSAKRAPKFAIDGDTTSAWLSATDSGADEWIELTIPATAITRLQFWAGWQATTPIYQGNRRPHNISVKFDDRAPIGLELKDVFGSQHVDLPQSLNLVGVTRIRFTVIDWYAAKKTSASGTPSRQVAISELRVYGIEMP
jgi:hypothetical protein